MPIGVMVGATYPSSYRRAIMLDVLFLVVIFALFAACALMVRGCERI
jgi:hypothetical protein